MEAADARLNICVVDAEGFDSEAEAAAQLAKFRDKQHEAEAAGDGGRAAWARKMVGWMLLDQPAA